MTPADFDAYLKAFGIPGGMLAAMVYLFMTRKTEAPGPSRLEEDMKAIAAKMDAGFAAIRADNKAAAEKAAADTKAVADEVHDIRDRVSRIEGRMDK